MTSHAPRVWAKRVLAAAEGDSAAVEGTSLLIYHRIGAGSMDELDVPVDQFLAQLNALSDQNVLSLDAALDLLDGDSTRPSIVLTFDDGFADIYENAWPLLRARQVPFTVYLASAYMGESMVWEGSTAKGPFGQGMSWGQLEEMVASGLCTLGNHTHTHVRPEALTIEELDRCSETIESHLGVRPRHFTYPWGIVVPELEDALAARFRSSSTGQLGRNGPDVDRQRLRRIPVRQSDPLNFFKAKLSGDLRAERRYAKLVDTTKAVLRRLPG